jgi:hypothetical protein
MSASRTDRRSFLKTGAVAASPLAVIAPAAALADDCSREKLARLEDERAIESLVRSFLRRFNGTPGADCGEFLARADAIELDTSVCSISEDATFDAAFEWSADGRTVSYERPCRAESECRFDGQTTLERMARFQGHGRHRRTEQRNLSGQFTRLGETWAIDRLRLA